jgi:dolichol-phosphate mannosyltransferase
MGVLFGLCCILMIGYVLATYFLGHTVSGWTSLAIIVLAVGSVQLIVAGVMGEYLGRLYMESKRRPLFVIDEVVTSANLAPGPAAASASPVLSDVC